MLGRDLFFCVCFFSLWLQLRFLGRRCLEKRRFNDRTITTNAPAHVQDVAKWGTGALTGCGRASLFIGWLDGWLVDYGPYLIMRNYQSFFAFAAAYSRFAVGRDMRDVRLTFLGESLQCFFGRSFKAHAVGSGSVALKHVPVVDWGLEDSKRCH